MTTPAATTKVEPIDAPYTKGYAPALVELAKIHPSPTNPRKQLGDLVELTASVKRHGILQPVLARPNAKGFELVSGHRRFAAAKAAGLESIPCVVREISDQETLEIQLVENCQRVDIHPLDEADAYELLHRKHKIDVDALAAKVGKSKAYVYARMKLCALKSETARKAFLANTINASVALYLARIPNVDLQEKAAKEVTAAEVQTRGKDDDGYERWQKHKEPMSARRALEHIQSHYMLRLADAPFDRADVDLVPTAGACTTCPKRTGNQKELFADVSSGDVCTDPKCFGEKRDAHWKLVKLKAEAEGVKTIEGKAAEKVFRHGREDLEYSSPYYAADAEVWDGNKHVKVAALIKKNDKIEKTLAKAPTGEIVELVSKDAINRLVSKEKPTQQRDDAAAEKRRQLENRIREKGTAAVIGAAVANAEKKGATLEMVRFLAAEGQIHISRLEGRRGVDREEIQKQIKSTKDIGFLVGVLVEAVLQDHVFYDTRFGRMVSDLGVNSRKVRDAVRAEITAKEKEKKAAKKTASKPVAAKGKPKK